MGDGLAIQGCYGVFHMSARWVRFVAALVLCSWTLLGSVPVLEACGQFDGTVEASHHGLETALLAVTRHGVVESRNALDHAAYGMGRLLRVPGVPELRLAPSLVVHRVPAPPPDDSGPLRHKLLSVYRL